MYFILFSITNRKVDTFYKKKSSPICMHYLPVYKNIMSIINIASISLEGGVCTICNCTLF